MKRKALPRNRQLAVAALEITEANDLRLSFTLTHEIGVLLGSKAAQQVTEQLVTKFFDGLKVAATAPKP